MANEIIDIKKMPAEIEEIKDDALIKIHNSIIQAYSELSNDAQKIFFIALSKMKDTTPNVMPEPIFFNIQEYLKTTRKDYKKMGGTEYAAIKNALNQLMTYKITPIGSLDDNSSYGSFIVAPSTFMNTEKGIFGLRLNYDFQRYLFGEDGKGLKKNYTIMLLRNYLKIKSRTALKMYALLYSRYRMTICKNKSNKEIYSKEPKGLAISVPIPVETIREMLFGSGSDRYASFKDFKKDIIVRSLNAINSQSDDMRVEIKELIRTGRKVTTINFLVRLNTNDAKEILEMAKIWGNMYKIANDTNLQPPDKSLVEDFKSTFGEIMYVKWLSIFCKNRNFADKYLECSKWLDENNKVNDSKVKEEMKKFTKRSATDIGVYASQLKMQNYIEFNGLSFWKTPTDEALYNKLMKLKTGKEEKQILEVKNYYALQGERQAINSDEGKIIETTASISNTRKELKADLADNLLRESFKKTFGMSDNKK